MKKVLVFCVAALAVLAVSCQKTNKGGSDIDWSKVTVDGFYVAGPATGSDEIKPECVMTAGVNEAVEGKPKRDGMYEKYIVLEANKDFYLLFNDGGKKERYSAALAEFVTPEEEAYQENPEKVLKGDLVIGDNAPAMKVEKTGLYHIVLDINKAGDLKKAQILLLDASEFGLRGGMNGWGFTAGKPEAFSNDGTVFKFTDQELAKNGEFKFATGNYWKVTLDDAGKVKAETSLGETGSGLGLAADNNIKVEKAGKYEITLNFKLAQGDFNKSFTYEVKLTEESKLPENMYMIGEGIAGWGLEDNPSQAVAMHPFHSQPGMWWAIRYIEAGKGFKFSTSNEKWGSDFATLGSNDEGVAVADNNCSVAASGVYCLGIDYVNGKIVVEPAKVYGMGDVFGSWDKQTHAFTVDGNKLVSPAAVAAGGIRSYVDSKLLDNPDNWWHAEFTPLEGKIFFREGGGDPSADAIAAGQKITYDFNAGTATIQ